MYTYRYIRRPALLSAAADRPIFPVRGDILRRGALAELALWPGTSTLKNPYYNVDQHRVMEEEFQSALKGAWKDEQEISNTAVYYDDWEGVPYAPIDARYLQTHDVF